MAELASDWMELVQTLLNSDLMEIDDKMAMVRRAHNKGLARRGFRIMADLVFLFHHLPWGSLSAHVCTVLAPW